VFLSWAVGGVDQDYGIRSRTRSTLAQSGPAQAAAAAASAAEAAASAAEAAAA
jgi:hypothetical protein